MNISDATARASILSFMSSRCDVSSQHKLPSLEDILDTFMAEYIGFGRTEDMVKDMLADGTLIAYGPYISDHEIDVM